MLSVDDSDLIDSLDFRRETSVNAEDFAVYNRSKGEIIEDFSEVVPWVDVSIFSEHFVIESVCLCCLSRFVVASKKSDTLGVFDLHAEEVFDCLDGIVSSIDEVSYEDVLVVRQTSTFVE